ncbi:hypothetical protein HCJ57_15525 [Listeria booriae]|uniref:Uncharacterized protein n=1 Tax=Listeria booriae TaxID=1552123 RepID=A0A7X1CGP7_9LIST|nr:hypothetical protein [Listeria booriae]MBC1563636.1 hypothetical protein [Listeria booriae]MBC2057936.1 hypothetical protein [Listeria booriae]
MKKSNEIFRGEVYYKGGRAEELEVQFLSDKPCLDIFADVKKRHLNKELQFAGEYANKNAAFFTLMCDEDTILVHENYGRPSILAVTENTQMRMPADVFLFLADIKVYGNHTYARREEEIVSIICDVEEKFFSNDKGDFTKLESNYYTKRFRNDDEITYRDYLEAAFGTEEQPGKKNPAY